MKISILRDWQALSALEPEWNALLTRSHANTLFLTWEWVQAWRALVGEAKQLYVVTVRDDEGRLLGVAPFYEYRMVLFKVIPYRALRVLGDYSTGFEYGDWFVDPDHEGEALSAIARSLAQARDWDLIWMPRMSGWSGALERLTPALNENMLFFRRRPAVFSHFPLPATLEAFENTFSSKRRQQLRRRRRNLMSTPGVAIEHCHEAGELPRFLDSLFDLHRRRRLLLGDEGCFVRRPAEAEHYRQFAARALAKGWLRFAALTQDGAIKAIQIGYAYNGNFHQLQEGFDPDYEDGAGNVLRHEVIAACIDEGLTGYDFLGGFSEHKRRWGAVERSGHDLLIGRPSLKTRLLFAKAIWPSGRHIREIGLVDGN